MMSLRSDHRYWIELLREPSGELLLQEQLAGIELLAAEARYELVSQGLLADEPECLAACTKPLVLAPGFPSLCGIRIEVSHARARDAIFAVDFPKEIAALQGLELAAQLAGDGVYGRVLDEPETQALLILLDVALSARVPVSRTVTGAPGPVATGSAHGVRLTLRPAAGRSTVQTIRGRLHLDGLRLEVTL